MAVLGVTNSFSSGTAIVASQMNTNFDDIEAFVNTTPGLLQLTGGTITGAVQLNNTLTLGSSGAGHDVILWGDTAGDYFWYDADTNKLVLEGANGATALDVTDGNVVIGDGTLTVGSDGAGEDVTFYSDTAGDHFVWDSSAEKLTITGTAAATALDIADGNVTIADDLDVDGTTNLDVVDIDGAVDMASTLTLAGNADFNGDLDVDGTTNLDAVDIDGAVQIDGTVTVGINDSGLDVIFYGATSGAYMKWNQTTDDLQLVGAAGLDIAGDVDIDGTTNLDEVDIDGAVSIDNTVTIGAYGFTIDTDCLYVDPSQNSVGINTTSPVASGFTIGRQPSDANEGGQLNFEGGTSYSNPMFIDRYQNDLRFLYNGSIVGRWAADGKITAVGGVQITSATQYAGLRVSDADSTIAEVVGFAADNDNGGLKLFNAGAVGVQLLASGVSYLNGGNVGIGSDSPAQKFLVYNGEGWDSGNFICLMENGDTDSGSGNVLQLKGGATTGDTSSKMFDVLDIAGNTEFFVRGDGVTYLRNASKDAGTFDIPHPIKGGDWRLRHSLVEAPRADLIYRGTTTLTGGTATIDLDADSNMTDGTWEALNQNPWAMVASSGNAVEWSLSGKTLTINSDTADAVCSWMVIGERHDPTIKDSKTRFFDDDGHLIVEAEDPSMPGSASYVDDPPQEPAAA